MIAQFTHFTPNELHNAREFLNETKSRHRALKDRIVEHNADLYYWKRRYEGASKARVIIQRVAQETQKNLEFHLITFWSLNKNRPSFALDEPFRNVSPDLQHKVSDMLRMVSEKLGVQIIMVSHQEDINISADKTFLTRKEGKVTILEEL